MKFDDKIALVDRMRQFGVNLFEIWFESKWYQFLFYSI